MNKLIFSVIALSALLSVGCAKVYYSEDAKNIASTHKTIAILPPKVTIAPQKKVDAEAIKAQQKTESSNFQKEMYSWLLRRKSQGKINVDILDVETTNVMLQRAGYFDGTAMTPYELCNTLGVDAVMMSNYSLSKPMSEGAAIAVGVLIGYWGSTNNTAIDLELYDKQTKKMFWNYNHKASGSVGSTPAQLVDNLMRNASKRMPY